MNPIFAAAREIQDFCRGRGWRSCVIGGLAVQRWGEPRLTRDVDVTLLTGFGAGFSWGAALAEIGTRASASETAGARVSESDGPEAAGPEGSDTIHD